MDNSFVYAKMNKTSREVQKYYKKNIHKGGGPVCVWDKKTNLTSTGWKPQLTDRYIWTPRQDELQKMVMGEFAEYPNQLSGMLLEFHFFVGNLVYEEVFTSMEQLWLRFVMRKLYKKVWEEYQWVRVKGKYDII